VLSYLGMRSSLHKTVLDDIKMVNDNHRSTKEQVLCSNSEVGKIFLTHLDQPLVSSNLLYSGYAISFPEVKRPWRGTDR